MFTASLIRRHEGLRLEAYKDTVGKLTVGYGFNLDAPAAKALCASLKLDYDAIRNGGSITEAQADAILDLQLGMVNAQAKTLFPNFNQMPADVQAVVQDLIFNLGLAGFSKFNQTIAALKAGDWPGAADHLTDSLWFKQVGSRAVEDVALLRAA
ncbi:glycoside hydrolase family protein [Edaphobacter paludis]|uniref:Lysozyme n=1 Tax=Edaphobacter paludis TaxID=3035702 RepID=A0AAU7D642_9BACT